MLTAKSYDNSLEVPLLDQEGKPSTGDKQRIFRASSLLLGLLIGILIQCSTLGANYIVISLWGEQVLQVSECDVIFYSLLWSFLTSTMAIVILVYLRNFVVASFSDTENIDEIVLHMECRFVMGALIGVCTAWAITDFALGLTQQVLFSIGTLVISLLWCRIMMWIFATARASTIPEKQTPRVLMIV